jgi:hemin uptake protein HemP
MLQTQTLHSTPHNNAIYESSDHKPVAAQHSRPNNKPPLPSESLLAGYKTVEILHNGSLYVLQATRLGKLILTK